VGTFTIKRKFQAFSASLTTHNAAISFCSHRFPLTKPGSCSLPFLTTKGNRRGLRFLARSAIELSFVFRLFGILIRNRNIAKCIALLAISLSFASFQLPFASCQFVRSSSSVLLPTSQLVFRFHIQLAHISNAATTNASGEHFSYAKVNTKHTQEMGINSKTNKPNKSINNLINNVYDCPEELIIIY